MTRYAQYPPCLRPALHTLPAPALIDESDADKRQEQPIGAHKRYGGSPSRTAVPGAIRSPKRRQGSFSVGWRRLFAFNFAFDFFLGNSP